MPEVPCRPIKGQQDTGHYEKEWDPAPASRSRSCDDEKGSSPDGESVRRRNVHAANTDASMNIPSKCVPMTGKRLIKCLWLPSRRHL